MGKVFNVYKEGKEYKANNVNKEGKEYSSGYVHFVHNPVRAKVTEFTGFTMVTEFTMGSNGLGFGIGKN